VRTGGLAEFTVGAATGVRNAMFMPIGTGIAAAVLVDGNRLDADGYAGEIGHIVVDPQGTVCGCGIRGCLETVASAAFIARRYAEASGRPVTRAADVAQAVRAGDPVAVAVWERAVDGLATALTTAITLLAPEIIAIGGGLAESGDTLLVPLRAALVGRMTFQRVPKIVRASLGDNAGCIGSAIMAWRAVG
jgi:glucokinase